MKTYLVEEKEYKQVIPYLQQNQSVVLPTETVYGLAANAESDIACKNIFVLKKRPADNPLIVHCSDIEMAQQYMCLNYEQAPTYSLSIKNKQKMIDWYKCSYNKALKILRSFAPAPISVITFASKKVSYIARAGSHTVAIRIPAHTVFRDIITAFGKSLAAPSANLSGFPSPTNALMAWESMSGRVPAIVDGGQCSVGLESTIVDCTGISLYGNSVSKYQVDEDRDNDSVCIVRAGSISASAIYEKTKLNAIDIFDNNKQDTQKISDTNTSRIASQNITYENNPISNRDRAPIIASVPGAKYRHYAPHTKVIPLNEITLNSNQSIEKIVCSTIIPLLKKDTVSQYRNIGLVLGPIDKDMHAPLYNTIECQQTTVPISMIRIFSTWQELAKRLYEYFATSDRLHLDVLLVCAPCYNCHSALYDRIQRAAYS